MIASEVVPFAKTGGLADVVGALPKALRRLGLRVTVFMPCYPRCWSLSDGLEATGVVVRVPVGSSLVAGHLYRTSLPDTDVTVYLIDHPDYYDRPGLYQEAGQDYPDNAARFVFFDRAVLQAIARLGLDIDVLHCNDWQTGLIPVYLRELYARDPHFEGVGTLLTIHNLAYQGLMPASEYPLTGLNERLFRWDQLEFFGQLNLLKSGLVFADRLNTVSPTYAREIQTRELGCGLDGLLSGRSADLSGIVNGIDTEVWNPSTDRHLAARYDRDDRSGKSACKAFLQRRAGLPERPDVPLFTQIGRLDPQKGWDLLVAVANDLLARDVQMVVLGVGQPRYHEVLNDLSSRYPGKLRAFLEFSPELAHQIEAGADIFLMPSLYEPCGLNQLYSLAYGTVPLVRATGGLADTVVDATPQALVDRSATGIQFGPATPEALREALGRALELWRDRRAWDDLVIAGMSADWSWDRSATQYAQLYRQISSRRIPAEVS